MIQDCVGKRFACACGREHNSQVRVMRYAPGAAESLAGLLEQYEWGSQLALLADQRTWPIMAKETAQALRDAGWRVDITILPDQHGHGPVCDDITLAQLQQQIKPCDGYVAVGTGVVNDLTKWLSYERKRPYVVLATAATMNGYSAANVAATLNGVKSIAYAAAPLAVLAEPEIIQNAPYNLTAAGLGDVIAKPISTADWWMNHQLLGEYHCQFCAEMINDIEPHYFNHPQAVRDQQPQAIQALMEGLWYSGLAMTMVGTSAPASGGEHMLSHTLDMMSMVDDTPHDLHGRQVGLGVIVAAALYERIFKLDRFTTASLPAQIDRDFWGRLADPVTAQYQQKKPLIDQIKAEINADSEKWQTFLAGARRQVRPVQQLKDCLQQAHAAHRYQDIGCTRQRFINAARHMHEIRKRPTVVDLAWILGILPDAADDIVTQWLER